MQSHKDQRILKLIRTRFKRISHRNRISKDKVFIARNKHEMFNYGIRVNAIKEMLKRIGRTKYSFKDHREFKYRTM